MKLFPKILETENSAQTEKVGVHFAKLHGNCLMKICPTQQCRDSYWMNWSGLKRTIEIFACTVRNFTALTNNWRF